MRISTVWYCFKQGLKNIGRNKLFSLASVATISACIFLFCLFYSLIINFQYIVKNAEATVGITVFFANGTSEEEILSAGTLIEGREEVEDCRFVSAEEAWEDFQDKYFGDMKNLAEGFADDNPLANSASLEIHLKDIRKQAEFVAFAEGMPNVRKVIYSSAAADGLSNFNRMIGYLSMIIIGILLAVSIFLISNTIAVAITVRRDEIRIMKLIGSSNLMIRAPFVVEGIIIGLLGTVIPLTAMFYIYENAVRLIAERFHVLTNLIVFLPISSVAAILLPVSLGLGAGIGLLGSITATHKHLRV